MPVAVLAVLGLGAGSFAVARTVASRTSGGTVQLVAADETGSHPFTEDASAVSLDDVSILIDGTADVGVVEAAAPTDGGSSGLTPVTADRSVLYGQGAAPVCDVDALLSGLAEDDRARSAWAEVMGVDGGVVEATVRSLTPLVLARDTAVTNTAYEKGEPRRFQAVLQAGTPVLVDQYGVPRVKCSCGNPLLPPDQDGELRHEGARWERFDPTAVVRVVQTRSAATEVPTVDLVTNQRTTATLGGSVSLDGYLFDDADGVYVVGADGTRTQVLDHPVAAVFDDGDGGLIYQRLRTGASLCDGCGSAFHLLNTSPTDAAEATVWHLPANATEPSALLVPPAELARNWQVIEIVGDLGGERVLVYTNVRFDPSVDVMDEGHHQASTVVRNLDTGGERTLHDWASTWEEPPGPFRLGDGLLLEDWSYVGPTYALYDAALTQLESSCDGEPEPEIDTCPSLATLVGAEEIVGIDWNDDGSQRGLVRRQLFTGAELAVIALPDLDGYARDLELDVHEGRGLLSVPTHAEARPFTLEVDLASGELTELGLAGRARWLRAPLLRPRPPVEDEGPAPEEPLPGSTAAAAPSTTSKPNEPRDDYDDARFSERCYGCQVAASASIDHPLYGPGRLEIVAGPGEYMDSLVGAYFRSERDGGILWGIDLDLDDVVAFGGTSDRLGHVFLAVGFGGPGSVPLVVVPTATGFSTLGTEAPFSGGTAPFGGADLISPFDDVDGDGTMELINSNRGCRGDACDERYFQARAWTWSGSTYELTTDWYDIPPP